MSVYESCGSCKGARSFKCSDCQCRGCCGSGKVPAVCSNCQGSAMITCEKCRGEGQLLKKKGWFSDSYDQCWRCSGSRQQKCSCESGKVSVKCATCKGTGRNAQCLKCEATGAIKCSLCRGSGQVPSEWYKSLAKMPIEKLKFEYEKRQRRIGPLQAQITRCTDEYDRTQREWDPECASGLREYSNRMAGEAMSAESEVGSLHEEMGAIEKVLESKWK